MDGQYSMILFFTSTLEKDLMWAGNLFFFELICQIILQTWSRSDFMAFPVSLPDDGLIDVMTMSRVRNESLLCHSKLTLFRLQGVMFSWE